MAKTIHAVSLVRNEDYVIAWAIRNVVDFADHVLVLHNRSTDRTGEILRALAAKHTNVEVVDVKDPFDTHRFVEPWVGGDRWVIRVDGDEIYNRDGLARLRPRLLAGDFDEHAFVQGPSVHPIGGALRGPIRGFTAPPAGTVAQLINLGAMTAWPSDRAHGRMQRLHAKKAIRFKPGYGHQSVLELYADRAWDDCDLRVAHMCFTPRSSDRSFDAVRPNPRWANLLRDPIAFTSHTVKRLFGQTTGAMDFKLRSYARGEPDWRSMEGFGGPADHRDVDPLAEAAERVLADALARGIALEPRRAAWARNVPKQRRAAERKT